MIWVYEKLPNRRPRCVSIKSIAWKPYYYAQETATGASDTDSLEKVFAETIDNKIPLIIRSINVKAGGAIDISEEDQGNLAFFLGLSFTRVPNFREGVNEIYSNIAQMVLDQKATRDPKLRDFVEKYGVKAKAKSWVSLKPMIQAAKDIANSALKKNWQFFVPPDGFSLISSDNPVHFSISDEFGSIMAGPGHPFAELVINLRSDLALVCTPKNYGKQFPVIQLNKQEAKRFNRGTARASERFVFANHYSEGIEKLTKKYAGEKQAIKIG